MQPHSVDLETTRTRTRSSSPSAPRRTQPKKEHQEQDMSSLKLPCHGTSSSDKIQTQITHHHQSKNGEADATVASSSCGNGRERLQRHRKEVAGKVWIPEVWGQEELLKDWVDCSEFDASLVPSGVVSARAALVNQASSTPTSSSLRIHKRC